MPLVTACRCLCRGELVIRSSSMLRYKHTRWSVSPHLMAISATPDVSCCNAVPSSTRGVSILAAALTVDVVTRTVHRRMA